MPEQPNDVVEHLRTEIAALELDVSTALAAAEKATKERDALHDQILGCSICAMKGCVQEGTEHFYVAHSVAFSMCPRHADAFKDRWYVRSGPEHCRLLGARKKAEKERDVARAELKSQLAAQDVPGSTLMVELVAPDGSIPPIKTSITLTADMDEALRKCRETEIRIEALQATLEACGRAVKDAESRAFKAERERNEFKASFIRTGKSLGEAKRKHDELKSRLNRVAGEAGLEDAIRDGDALTRLSQELRTRRLRGGQELGAVDAALTAIDRLTEERDDALQQVAALRARLFPSPTIEQAYVVTCEKCGRKLVTRWITTGPVGGVDVATCPCGYNILSESEGNAATVAELISTAHTRSIQVNRELSRGLAIEEELAIMKKTLARITEERDDALAEVSNLAHRIAHPPVLKTLPVVGGVKE